MLYVSRVFFHAILALIVNVVAPDCIAQNSTEPLMLAHYMPWYSARPEENRWGWHWTMNHFKPGKMSDGRRQIASKYYPLIGPYDSGDISVIEYHLLLMKASGIDGVIVDWYGRTDFRDYAILHKNTTRLLQQCERLKMKFVICYEDQTIPALETAGRIKSTERVLHAVSEIEWLQKYWFKSPSYVRFDGKPVMLSFGHAGLNDQEWQQCLSTLNKPIEYYSQDYRRNGAIGGFDWPNTKQGVSRIDQFLSSAKRWPDAIPIVYPRFDDIYREAKVSQGYAIIPDRQGKTFKQTLAKAMAAKTRIIQISTWNDWGEGTQIEPSAEFGYRDLEELQNKLNGKQTEKSSLETRLLRIPYRILELRKQEAISKSKIDFVVELFSHGNFDAATQELNSLN